jgi:hypothetical protein
MITSDAVKERIKIHVDKPLSPVQPEETPTHLVDA